MSAPKFSRIATDLGKGPIADDWVFLVDGKESGRCYAGTFGMNVKGWRWSIYNTNRASIEPSLPEAEAAFKRSYLEWKAS